MARPLGKERNAVAGPFGHNPEGSGHWAPIAALRLLAWHVAKQRRRALHWEPIGLSATPAGNDNRPWAYDINRRQPASREGPHRGGLSRLRAGAGGSHSAGGEQDLASRGGSRSGRRRAAGLRRKLCAGGGGQGRGSGGTGAGVALHRPPAEQQDPAGGGPLPMGPFRGSSEDRPASLGAARPPSATPQRLPPGERERRSQQERCGA